MSKKFVSNTAIASEEPESKERDGEDLGVRDRAPQPVIPLTTRLKSLYASQDTLPKLVEDASVPLQKMDDYYVKLQIVLNDKKSSEEKQPIGLSQMFEAVGDQNAVGKILIVGVAGIGKTTFLNHISYEWSKGKAFNDKFDYIFKIRLKSLLDENLAQELSNDYSREDRLPAFIQRCIEQQQQELRATSPAINPLGISIASPVSAYMASTESAAAGGGSDSNASVGGVANYDPIAENSTFGDFSIEEIRGLDKTKIVLLLDGYDEIEHLNRASHVARDIISKIFEYPNVVLTSRPNAVTSVMEDRFERKIEAVGLGQDGIVQYIDRYFSKQGQGLSEEIDSYLLKNKAAKKAGGDIKLKLLQHYERQEDTRSKEILASLEAIDNYSIKNGGDGIGETEREIKQSIEVYHKGLEQSLLNIYKGNPILRDTLVTPINLAMVCLISTDQTILEKFMGEFNIGGLYEGVVVWLGKRYLTKFKERDAKEAMDSIDIVNDREYYI